MDALDRPVSPVRLVTDHPVQQCVALGRHATASRQTIGRYLRGSHILKAILPAGSLPHNGIEWSQQHDVSPLRSREKFKAFGESLRIAAICHKKSRGGDRRKANGRKRSGNGHRRRARPLRKDRECIPCPRRSKEADGSIRLEDVIVIGPTAHQPDKIDIHDRTTARPLNERLSVKGVQQSRA